MINHPRRWSARPIPSLSRPAVPTATWSLGAGTLPPGLELDTSGILTGTPTASGLCTFTVLASNIVGAAEQTITLPVNQAPAITNDQPPAALVGETYTFTFTASGVPTPTWTVSAGLLPLGLSLDPVTGMLSGTPTIEGVYDFSIEATNGFGSPAARHVTLTVMTRRWLPIIVN
ncbi:MAG TPA: Ig domain-containing protein [Roseiflexaceae bacterium]|nr:Ig domain-containing protein [Roseiflexaceae bacterium]